MSQTVIHKRIRAVLILKAESELNIFEQLSKTGSELSRGLHVVIPHLQNLGCGGLILQIMEL